LVGKSVIVPDPHHESWGTPPLPEKITAFRPAQLQAVDEILWRFEFGAKYVVLDAPTGAGKTLIAEMVRRQLKTRGLYMCVDKGLQRQFRRDFEYARYIMGRANYPTLDYPERFETDEHLSCDDCNGDAKKRCDWCVERNRCPYMVAKREALEAQLSCVNIAYFLSECNGPGAFAGWPLVIADEGDRLEKVLMSYVEATVGKNRLVEWSIKVPEEFVAGRPEPALVERWIDEVMDSVDHDMRELAGVYKPTVQERRKLRRLSNLWNRLEALKKEYAQGGWVVQAKNEDSAVVFKPVKVDTSARSLLWDHGQKWLLMSATVLAPDRMMADLGVLDSWAVVRMPSSFPATLRPVRITPVADVTAKNMVEALPKLADAVLAILAHHQEHRVLVHTVSYKLAKDLRRLLPSDDRYFWLEGSAQLEGMLSDYLARPDSVLIAPALERGLDLPDDACRVVIICKAPFPSLGDPQVNARMNLPGGRQWYTDQTLRSLVQMTGRGVRHETDWCITYVLDNQVDRLVNQYHSRLPSWWLEAVVR